MSKTPEEKQAEIVEEIVEDGELWGWIVTVGGRSYLRPKFSVPIVHSEIDPELSALILREDPDQEGCGAESVAKSGAISDACDGPPHLSD